MARLMSLLGPDHRIRRAFAQGVSDHGLCAVVLTGAKALTVIEFEIKQCLQTPNQTTTSNNTGTGAAVFAIVVVIAVVAVQNYCFYC